MTADAASYIFRYVFDERLPHDRGQGVELPASPGIEHCVEPIGHQLFVPVLDDPRRRARRWALGWCAGRRRRSGRPAPHHLGERLADLGLEVGRAVVRADEEAQVLEVPLEREDSWSCCSESTVGVCAAWLK
jgi:hypothetical protein